MILLEMPEIYNSARKHLTFFEGRVKKKEIARERRNGQ
jgi:hypothetical protein